MQCFSLNVYEGRSDVTLKVYLKDFQGSEGPDHSCPAVLVLPGGGFFGHIEREGEPVALYFTALGYQAFVLEYSVGIMSRMPNPIVDTAKAIALMRARAKAWGIDPHRVVSVGFGSGAFMPSFIAYSAMLSNNGFGRVKALMSPAEASIVNSMDAKPNVVVLVNPMIEIDEVIERLEKLGEPGQHQGLMLRNLLFGEARSVDVHEEKAAANDLLIPSEQMSALGVWESEAYLLSSPMATRRLIECLKQSQVHLCQKILPEVGVDIHWAIEVDRWIKSVFD